MTKIDCGECSDCCKDPLNPVLMPYEENDYPGSIVNINTPYRVIHTLAKKDGHCIFLIDGKCTIYNKRPFECRIYPYLLDFSRKPAGFKLDKRFCKKLHTLNAEKISLDNGQFDDVWIRAYESLDC
ncbi:MAG TPA: YkgJ family cysteine cluster protein [Candidatus Nanoarchaeia archaeon]|nr:YkgJ family cysteine cluster protein [Candidatus Nanoarchaeia archaeon]